MLKKRSVLVLSVILTVCFIFGGCTQKADDTDSKKDSEINSSASSENTSGVDSSDSKNSDNSSKNDDDSDSQNTDVFFTSGKPVEESFFDDAVFVGDSVSLKLNYYADYLRDVLEEECLGKAQFLCAGSLGYANALWSIDDKNSVHPSYKGKKYLIEDGVKEIGAKKVFIMLGMNDFFIYGKNTTRENAYKLISKILEKSPDAQIYVQSVTPIIKKGEHDNFTNEKIRELNKELIEMCIENNWRYLDIASVVTDKDGYLKDEFCGDPENLGIHFTNDACEKWVEYLENNAG